jgi:hypothetical protein
MRDVRAGEDTDKLAVDLEIAETKEGLDVGVLEGDEPEALAAARLAVEHDRRVNDLAELGEELAHGLGRHAAREPTDEELRRALVLLPRDGALGIDLCRGQPVKQKGRGRLTIFPSRRCSRTMTALTLAGSSNVRNAKQRERPAASRMMVHASTLPNCVKYVRRLSRYTDSALRTTHITNGVCTICSVPVETADEHFAMDAEVDSGGEHMEREQKGGISIL